MSETFARLRDVELFDGLSDEDLERICTDVQDVRLAPGEVLFREGDPGDRAYVITAGEIEILKATSRRESLLAVHGPGVVIGEMALLQEEPRIASVRARTEATLVAIPKSALDDLLDTSPAASRALFNTFRRRLRETHDEVKQSERMVQLGTLTAGVAHELNNPAAAVARAAERLADELATFTDRAATAGASGLRAEVVGLLRDGADTSLDALARSDAEADIEDWLDDHGVAEPWELSAQLVDAGISVDDLAGLEGLGAAAPDELTDAIQLLVGSSSLRRTAAEITEGANRISSIVRSLKSYTYLDRAPVQDVDVLQGIEDTLVLLAHKTRHVHVQREFEDDLPLITALGTELNQVWTNLIDNACAALGEVEGRIPTLTIRASSTDDEVVVEVEDNGPGIPPEHQERIFDAFFTTKSPGEGTGLGLQISYRIVVLEHRGRLAVTSAPGRTTFRVTLPIEQPEPPTTEEVDMTTGPCTHLNDLPEVDAPSFDDGCPACVEAGDSWVHLRYCATCGLAGCCDDSPNQHARKHATGDAGHPVIKSLEPGEHWAWCFDHDGGISL